MKQCFEDPVHQIAKKRKNWWLLIDVKQKLWTLRLAACSLETEPGAGRGSWEGHTDSPDEKTELRVWDPGQPVFSTRVLNGRELHRQRSLESCRKPSYFWGAQTSTWPGTKEWSTKDGGPGNSKQFPGLTQDPAQSSSPSQTGNPPDSPALGNVHSVELQE